MQTRSFSLRTGVLLLTNAGGCLGLMYAGSLLVAPWQAQAAEYGALPDAPRAAPVVTDATYYLSIVVNGQSDNQVVPVVYRNNAYWVEAGVLAKNHVRLNGQQQGLVNIASLPQVKAQYVAATQQYILQLRDVWQSREIDSIDNRV